MAVGICIVGCDVDLATHTVYGPTPEQHMNSLAMMPIGLEFPSGAFELQYRASELHDLLDPFAKRNRVTAVLSAETEDGAVVKIVASSEHRLSKAQRLALMDDEIEAIGYGHAEVTAIDFAEQNNLMPRAIAASSAICKTCGERISSSGVARITRLRPE